MGMPRAWSVLIRMPVTEIRVNERELEGATSEGGEIQTTYCGRSQNKCFDYYGCVIKILPNLG